MQQSISSIMQALNFENQTWQNILMAAVVLVIGLIVIKILLTAVRKVLVRSSIDSVLYVFIINCVKIISLIILIIMIFDELGVPTTSFVTLVAALGAAVALSVQESLSNFAGGLLIMVSKPFSRGDLIEVDGVTGRVREINLLHSTLVALDNRVMIIPNGTLANNTIVNFSKEEFRRVDVKIGVDYRCSQETARSAMEDAVKACPQYFADPYRPSCIEIASFDESQVTYDVLVWCRTEDYFDAKYELLESIQREFKRHNISMPYPQMTVHFADRETSGIQNTEE